VSIAADTVRDTVVQVAESMGRQGIPTLALANAHLDPGHITSLRGAVDRVAASAGPPGPARLVFLDLTRRRVAERLTEEFRSGACHAGQFEGSIVLAEAPELVRTQIAAGLAPVPASLSDAIRDGKSSFQEAGGERAYFGRPAGATAEEGRASVATLGTLLAEMVLGAEEALEDGP
jgi:creatinine amidohydrolase